MMPFYCVSTIQKAAVDDTSSSLKMAMYAAIVGEFQA
jgi:hypothetical protein